MNYLMTRRLFKAVENKIPWHLNLIETLGCHSGWKVVNIKPPHFAQYCQVTTHSPSFIKNERSLVTKIVKKLSVLVFSKSKLKASGYYLYETVADHIDYETFFKEFSLPDTFNSWFLVTELHVWMLMVRCMADEEHGRYARNAIVEAMWRDVAVKSSKLGSEHKSAVREQLIELSENFQAALLTYDEGLLKDDKILAGAVWRRFFSKQCSDPLFVENIVRYIRQQIIFLDYLENETFFQRRFIWPSLNYK